MSILEICAIIAVSIFALLAGFIIRTLIPLQRSFDHVEKDLKKINPLIETFSQDTDIKKLKEKEAQEKLDDHIGFEVVEWLLLSYKLGEKLIKRR